MRRAKIAWVACALAVTVGTVRVKAAVIGVDAVHGFDANSNPATGPAFSLFRSTITAHGDTIVPLTSFTAASLAGLDEAFFVIPYSQNTHPYSAAEMTAIRAFANVNQVFLSDTDIWNNTGDRPISFGNNQKLLQNILSFSSTGHTGVFLGDDGSGFDVANFNTLVAPYGITYAGAATDPTGRTVTGFVPHPLTSGVTQLGVDFQLPLTVSSPGIDLTTGGGQDNILAVAPEPTLLPCLACATSLLPLLTRRRRGHGSATR
jgi:hypothetical protein